MNKSFEDVIDRLSPTLRRITHKLNGHFSFFDEDDLFQEALECLWIWFRQGRLGDKTDSYLLQGCYYYLKNYLRKTLDKASLISLSSIIDEDGSTIEEFLSYEDKSPASAAEETMLDEEIDHRGLTGREKMVLKYSLEGLTIREMGARLGVSHVMVVKLKKRIKVKCLSIRNRASEGYQN